MNTQADILVARCGRLRRARWGLAAACCLIVLARAGAVPSVSEASSPLPDTTAAANFVVNLAEEALPAPAATTWEDRAVFRVIEAGFLVGTTTAVHELGHARRVRAVGGVSRWETGDVNWWAYLQHRDPLAAGATNWLIPIRTSLDQKIAILAGGFNATTAWDEAVAGRGPLDLVTARYSTLFYELAGVNRGDDDLSQLQKLYLDKGYKISRREMQLWQLAAGCLTQFGGKVRAYAYYTPEGVSVKTVTTWDDWILSAETVVHGTSTLETEVGRRLCLNRHMMIMPKILFSEHGVGGEMAVDLTFGRLAASVFLQKVCAGSLQSWRASTSANLQVAVAM